MAKKITKEEFIKRANLKWHNKYDYSKLVFVDMFTTICIICPKHGEFYITPRQHLWGHGCTKCAKNGRLNTEEFIIRAKAMHGNKYDYSKVEYKSAHEKVCIICPNHGEFLQSPNAHLRGQGCRKCHIKYEKKEHYDLTNIIQGEKEYKFINKANLIHNNKYDYSKVVINDYNSEVYIICPIHGGFWQRVSVHLHGSGCIKCGIKKINKNSKISLEKFTERANEIHSHKYDYSKVNFNTIKDKVSIICPIHGEFLQSANSHLHGSGCPMCWLDKNKKTLSLTTEEFITRSKEIHNNKYDYSKVEYKNLETKVCIICPIHGEFWQRPNCHLNSKGCPMCKSSKLEMEITLFLNDNHIEYKTQYTPKFLQKGRKKYRLDFYLPKYNIAIECQGLQHFKPFNFGSKSVTNEERFNQICLYDKFKFNICRENCLDILYYTNVKSSDLPTEYLSEIYTNKDDLLNKILSYG